MANSKRPCAYCGTTDVPRTSGHVISKSIYPDSLKNARRITVPECLDCKAIWEDAEPHFRNIIIAIWNPEMVLEDNRYNSMKRSLKKCDGPRRLHDFAAQLVPTDTSQGTRQSIYPAKDPQCNLILRRIVRGLCFHHGFGSAIADTRVWCDVMQFVVPKGIQSTFTYHEIAPGLFRYGYTVLDDDVFHSAWLFRFSQHIEFIGLIAANASGFPAANNGE